MKNKVSREKNYYNSNPRLAPVYQSSGNTTFLSQKMGKKDNELTETRFDHLVIEADKKT